MKTYFIVLCSLLLAGCNLNQPYRGIPQAWIDAPLDGSTLPLAPLEIVAHSNDPAGIQEIEFSINGTVIAQQTAGDSNQSLYTVHQEWVPPVDGAYTLQVRARNAGGFWGDYASVVFTVGAVTSALTDTPQPATTLTPTAYPTVASIDFTLVQATPNLFHHSHPCGPNDPNCQTSCSPNQISIRAQVSAPELVSSVVLFFSLAGKKSSTGWNEGVSMKSLGNGIYEYNLLADKVPDAQSFGEAIFKYQFVATDVNENVLARSQVFSDVTLSACP